MNPQKNAQRVNFKKYYQDTNTLSQKELSSIRSFNKFLNPENSAFCQKVLVHQEIPSILNDKMAQTNRSGVSADQQPSTKKHDSFARKSQNNMDFYRKNQQDKQVNYQSVTKHQQEMPFRV